LSQLRINAFAKIKSIIADGKILELYNYFEDYYLGKEKVGRGREVDVFKKPLFTVNLWKVNEPLKECIPKTNNFVESWNKSFSSLLNKHRSVFSLVNS